MYFIVPDRKYKLNYLTKIHAQTFMQKKNDMLYNMLLKQSLI